MDRVASALESSKGQNAEVRHPLALEPSVGQVQYATTGLFLGILGRLLAAPGMRERIYQLGGNLEIQSDSMGTTITATLPIAKAATLSAQEVA
jgi:glucose-6-phosphate-specific signal transduction histidine kinase